MADETSARLLEVILGSETARITASQALAAVPQTPAQILDLIHGADRIRRHFKKQAVFACAIVNAKSGHCPEDCAFCAQSALHQTDIRTYELLDAKTLIETGLRAAAAGASHFSMVTSGTALTSAEIDTVCRAATALRAKTSLTLCASLGMLDAAAAGRLKQAGIARYHHNLETARSHFDRICSTHDYEDDIRTIQEARSAGLEVCSGGIFGLGETWDQRVELAFTLRELEVDSIPINFLNPIAGTRLAGRPRLAPLEALACIALYRFILADRDIPVCGGRGATLGDFQSWVFLAGANGLMVGDYLTTLGRCFEMDMQMIQAMGVSVHAAC